MTFPAPTNCGETSYISDIYTNFQGPVDVFLLTFLSTCRCILIKISTKFVPEGAIDKYQYQEGPPE